jgi:hypothetical protein
MRIFILITSCILSILSFNSCKTDVEDKPILICIDSLKQTEFVLALEKPINDTDNIIYTPTILFAWDEIRQLTGATFYKDSLYSDFDLLNKSMLFRNSMNKEEYKTETEINGAFITSKAFFEKSLSFEPKFQKSEIPIRFNGMKAKAFGMYEYDEEIARNIKLLYYQSDDRFILSLMPKDKSQQIIMAKGMDSIKSLYEGIEMVKSLSGTNTQYDITPIDYVLIPVVSFNLDKFYKELEGKRFFTDENKAEGFTLLSTYQRTMFVLNETGAKVESEAEIKVKADSISAIQPKPKRLVFDQPFLIIMKHIEKENPYFVAIIANTELLTKY